MYIDISNRCGNIVGWFRLMLAATTVVVVCIYDCNDECVAPNIAGDDVLYV